MLLKQEEVRLDPRLKRTRRMLQQALVELMHEQTFQSITVQDIAERATVNRATFYDHFADKFALLEYSIREKFDEELHSHLAGDAGLSLEALRTLIETICAFMEEGHRHCKPVDEQLLRLVESQTTGKLVELLTGWLEEAQRRNGPQQASVELTANMIGWAIFGAARHWQEDKKRPPASVFAGELLPVIVATLHHSFYIEGVEAEPGLLSVVPGGSAQA